jgi:hypothetical protein
VGVPAGPVLEHGESATRQPSARAPVKTVKKVRLVDHQIFHPAKGETLDLEATLKDAVRTFARRFRLKKVRTRPSTNTPADAGFRAGNWRHLGP